jgi:hypothetical protein
MEYRIHYFNPDTQSWPHSRVTTDENGIITDPPNSRSQWLGKNIAEFTAEGYKVIQQPQYIINRQWSHFDEVYSLFTCKGYNLDYSRPSGSQDPTPWESCINPSFTHWQFCGNSFQLIWNRKQPREIFLNHGWPDVYNHIREALTAAGFTLIDINPNR